MIVQSTIKVGDKEYLAELGKIDSTMLGFEDHGFLSSFVILDFGGTSQGFGGTVLGLPERRDDAPKLDTHVERWVRGVLNVVGVDFWEKLPGKHIYALRTERAGTIVGIASWDGKRVFMAQEKSE